MSKINYLVRTASENIDVPMRYTKKIAETIGLLPGKKVSITRFVSNDEFSRRRKNEIGVCMQLYQHGYLLKLESGYTEFFRYDSLNFANESGERCKVL